MSGYGLAMWLGYDFVSLASILPFLLVAIGVDNMFIIVDFFDRYEYIHDNMEERARKAMKSCGMSITLTSLTDTVAFLFGLNFPYPAVQSFCIYAAFAILLNYLFMLTLFVAILTRDLRRQADAEICCCATCCLPCGNGNVISWIDLEKLWNEYLLSLEENVG